MAAGRQGPGNESSKAPAAMGRGASAWPDTKGRMFGFLFRFSMFRFGASASALASLQLSDSC